MTVDDFKNFRGFTDLSEDEQDSVLETLIESLRDQDFLENNSGYDLIPMLASILESMYDVTIITPNPDDQVTIDKIIDLLGYDKVVEGLKKAFSKGDELISKFTDEEIQEAIAFCSDLEERNENLKLDVEKGVISQEKANYLRKDKIFHYNRKEDVLFSTFAILDTFVTFLEKNREKRKEGNKTESPRFVEQAEPLALALQAYVFASLLSKPDSLVRKVFDKFGYERALSIDKDLDHDLTSLITGYCSENDIDPARCVASLTRVISIMVGTLNFSLTGIKTEYLEDYIALTYLSSMANGISEEDEIKLKDILFSAELYDSSHISEKKKKNKKSANADKKEKKDKNNVIDIRQVLLDD